MFETRTMKCDSKNGELEVTALTKEQAIESLGQGNTIYCNGFSAKHLPNTIAIYRNTEPTFASFNGHRDRRAEGCRSHEKDAIEFLESCARN